jgi:hypothetical protein
MRQRDVACIISAGLLAALVATAGHLRSWKAAAERSKSRPGAPMAHEVSPEGRAVATKAAPAGPRNLADLGKLPLYFIENRGQLDRRVAYYVPGHNWSLYLSPGGVTYALTAHSPRPEAGRSDRPRPLPVAFARGREAERQARRWVLKLEFVDADPAVRPVGTKPAEAVVSYFKGSPDQWKTGLPTYAEILYPDLWPGIDLVSSSAGGRPKQTFVVRPGADPGRIRLAWHGAEQIGINAAGELEVSTPLGALREDKPYAYQELDGGRVEIPAAFRLEGGNAYSFQLGRFDPAKPLVVDPVLLVYAGFIGGSGDDGGNGIAVDQAGHAYVTGDTSSDHTSFPVTVGPDTSYNGGFHDAFVAKVKADGSGLLWAGYLGGSGNDFGNGIAVDQAGHAYVTGSTDSRETSFPVTVGPDTSFNGGFYDAFVAKVKADGSGLLWAGYIGGSGNDFGNGIAVDQAGHAYVTGSTASHETSFPVTVGPDASYNGGIDDAFVAKVKADGSGLLWAGYIGGAGNDVGNGIAVDQAGHAYLTGSTTSDETSFPVTVGPDTSFNGGYDAFVAKVKADGSGLLWAGYLGGLWQDSGSGIAVDQAGHAYVTGSTASHETSFPVTVGPDTSFNGGLDAFVAKVKADGSGLLWAGYIGGLGDDGGYDIAVDRTGHAYLTGFTKSDQTSFPVTVGPDTSFNGGFWDAFVAKVKADGSGLLWAGYIGGSGSDFGFGIAVDHAGNAYLAGRASSDQTSFPVTVGPDTSFNGGETDAFVVKVGSSLLVSVDLKPQSNPNCVNPQSRGVVSVAIFGSSTFGVASIDRSTLVFGGAAPLRCSFEDAYREGPTGIFSLDGIPDLVCHFSTQAVSWPAAGANCGRVALAGRLLDGTAIEGGDIACRSGEPTCAAGTPIPVP